MPGISPELKMQQTELDKDVMALVLFTYQKKMITSVQDNSIATENTRDGRVEKTV